MEEKKPERAYPANFVRYGHNPYVYMFLLVYMVMCLQGVPEMIRTDPALAPGIVIGGLVIMKLLTLYGRLRGLYSVKLRYVFFPQVGVKAAPATYFVSVVMLALALWASVYGHYIMPRFNDDLLLPILLAPYPVIGYMAMVNFFLNHGGTLPDRYMPF